VFFCKNRTSILAAFNENKIGYHTFTLAYKMTGRKVLSQTQCHTYFPKQEKKKKKKEDTQRPRSGLAQPWHRHAWKASWSN